MLMKSSTEWRESIRPLQQNTFCSALILVTLTAYPVCPEHARGVHFPDVMYETNDPVSGYLGCSILKDLLLQGKTRI